MVLSVDNDLIHSLEAVRDKVYFTAQKLLVSKDEAEDATQDVLLKLWEMDRAKIKTLKNIEAYSVTMVKNYCIDRLKSKQAQQLPLDNTIKFKSSSLDLDKSVDVKDKYSQIKSLINQLPKRERAVLKMRDFEQLEFKHIAKKMNIPEGSVRVYLSRARMRLRKEFIKIENYGIYKSQSFN
ncbi:MAG: sigma-70 family RNA polymerase sigma factor [Flavobacteriaceae bacterium]|nr:sigma-70 family RNA polymerase sigma factor [Flavobacteriaceae bacterium]MCY4254337.1 sigma-70 family RNA polymerase sigma factor [Flavobacteriaceae bacterium]